MIDIDWEYENGKMFGCGEDELCVFICNATAKRSFIFNRIAKTLHNDDYIEFWGRDARDKAAASLAGINECKAANYQQDL